MEHYQSTSSEKIADLLAIRASHTGIDSASQGRRLLVALGRHSINTFEAMRYLDVYHAPARILQLREAGHSIVTHWQTVTTEAGAKHRVGLYVLQCGDAT